jgi:surface polysaccharide O-acyltransferase-like enzyme
VEQRLDHLDFLRVVAMAGAMLIHATSGFIFRESSVLILGMNLAFVGNQVARFCVPLFLLLSGFSLGRKAPPPSHLAFLRGRLVRVVLPYLGWVLLYELWNCRLQLGVWLGQLRDLRWLGWAVLTGQTVSHLYFIPLLVQFYLLLPLLRRWADRHPAACLGVTFLCTVLLQGLHCLQGLGLLPSNALLDWLNRLCPGWGFYFAVGLVLARGKGEAWGRGWSKFAGRLTAALGALLFLYAFLAHVTGLLDAMRPSLTLLTPLVFLWGLAAWERLQGLPGAGTAVRFLAARSMGMYCNHVLVLYVLRYVPWCQAGMGGMALLFLGTFGGSALLASLTRWGWAQAGSLFKQIPKILKEV